MSPSNNLTPQFETIHDLVGATNDVREGIVRALDEYNRLSVTMREFEKLFSAQVLRTARRLRDIVEQRRRLEAECQRIRSKSERGGYERPGDVEDEVRAVLVADETDHGDASGDARGQDNEADGDDAQRPRDDADADGPDDADRSQSERSEPDGHDGLDPAAKDRILRAFKRIVLPSVHSDTSDDATFRDFDAAFGAYKTHDYTLMEAFVIRYRGEVGAADDDGHTLTRDQASSRLREYEAVSRRLDGRLQALRRQASDQELTSPDAAKARMARQNEEFRQEMDREAERIQELRDYLARLVRKAREPEHA